MFADDTVIYHSDLSRAVLMQELPNDLDAVNIWCSQNYITLNISKSQYANFGYRKPTDNNFVLRLGDATLDKVDSYKYLGTVIDCKLNGDAQYARLMQTLGGKK